MKPISTRQLVIIAVFCFAILSASLFWLLTPQKPKKATVPPITPVATTTEEIPAETEASVPAQKVIGKSVGSREIESYTFGSGPTRLVFVGGIHGGYEWNGVLLAYQFIDYLRQNPEFLPKNLAVTIIPDMNPDGIYKIIGKEGQFVISDVPAGTNEAGRLNAHGVDLNRNFACNWKSTGVWQNKTVSGGTAAFSEPESAAIKKFVLDNKPAALLFWHSQAGEVDGSECGGNELAETREITDVYAKASGYKAVLSFDGYDVSGDVTDWLASINIPAISVELSTHKTTEWEKNLAGITALFKYYGDKK